MSSSTVTYTSIYTDTEPGIVYWGDDEELSDGGPDNPPSPDYVPDPEHPPSPVEIPYVPNPEYHEYLVPSDANAPLKDQPLPVDASPTVASPRYVDGDDEPSDDDDDDTDDKDEEPFEDEEDNEEEEEHLASTDSSVVPIVDPIPPAGDTEAFETDEGVPTPRSPQTIIPFLQTCLGRAWKTVKLEPPMSASMEACIARHVAALTPSLPIPSPPLPFPSPLTISLTDAGAPLGYRAAGIRMRALLPSTSRRTNILKADMPPPKEGLPYYSCSRIRTRGEFRSWCCYGITDTWDEIVDTLMEIALTTLEGVDQRVTKLDTTVRQRTKEFEKMAPKKRTTRETPTTTTTPTTTVTDAQLQALIDRGVAAALVERDADRSRDGDNNHGSGTGRRRQVPTQRECTYTEFLKCQPMNFKGTEGVIGLTQWVEKMESVFLISNYTITSQELALMCDRMFLEESTKVERYIGGLPDMIHGRLTFSRLICRLRKRACLTTLARGFELGESSAAGAVRKLGPALESDRRRYRVEQTGYGITDTWDEIVDTLMEIALTTLEGVDQRVTKLDTTVRQRTKEFEKMAPKKRTTRETPTTTTTPTTTVTDAQLQALIDRGVAAALVERDADRSRDGDNNHGSGTGRRRQVPTQRECTYTEFLKCQPMNFKGTEGVIGLTQWVEKMESVFLISNYTITSQSMQESIEFAIEMMDKKMLTVVERQSKNKRKFQDTSRNNQNQHQLFKRNNVAQAYTAGPGDKKPYGGTKPLCTKCNYHHDGPCDQKCTNCKKIVHSTRDCKGGPATTNKNNNNNHQRAQRENLRSITFFECGVQGHFRSDCPKLKNGNQGNRARNGNAVARAYDVGTVRTNPNSNVVTGTFLLNYHYASILINTGADRSFISTAFSSLIDIILTTLDHGYDVELANGRIIWDYTLNFLNHSFNIDLMPVEIGSFDVIICMDWLAKYHAVIFCDEKLIRVPFDNEILIFHGDGSNNEHESRLNIILCTKTQKYLLKGCPVFLAHATTGKAEDKSMEKRLKDVPIVQDFPKVFPEDLLVIPRTRQVEFQIDLIPGVAPVARAPYRLAPFEMKELSNQLKEHSDKEFIRPISLPWGAPVLFVKKKDGSLVKNKQEKDKIETKPDQIKKKREAWKSLAVSKTNHSQNIRKKKKIQSPRTKTDKP
nr:putative reverse transcriptase domain-containing protein [Tanacetum cinerariifolium]